MHHRFDGGHEPIGGVRAVARSNDAVTIAVNDFDKSSSPLTFGPPAAKGTKIAISTGNADALGRFLHNRLQPPAFALAPVVEKVYCRLAAQAPAGCLMSGSGSAVFALARDAADARRIVADVRPWVAAAGGRVMAARTL